MKQMAFIIITMTLLFSCTNRNNQPPGTYQHYTFEMEDQIREYILYIPMELPENPPLLFILHGFANNNLNMMNLVKMNSIAEEKGFIICYPQGELDYQGNTHWNASLSISNVKDVPFLSSLAVYLQDQWGADTERTWTCGFSNGGYMSYELVCARPDVFKAGASVGGTMSATRWRTRPSSHPVPVLQIHGMADTVIPPDGSMGPGGGWGGAPSLDVVMEYWGNLNNCTSTDVINLSEKSTALRYSNEFHARAVEYVKVEGLGHQWPGAQSDSSGIDASTYIVEFFYANSNL